MNLNPKSEDADEDEDEDEVKRGNPPPSSERQHHLQPDLANLCSSAVVVVVRERKLSGRVNCLGKQSVRESKLSWNVQ